MVFAERLLLDRQRALVEALGVGVLALRQVHAGQGVEVLSHVGVVFAERLLADRQRALGEPFGVGVFGLMRVHEGQVVEGSGHIGVVFAERLLVDRQRALVELLGVGILALPEYTMARLLRVMATSGWSAPSAFSRIASARL